MNWLDVGKAIAPIAPLAGKIIGGFIPFPGAGLIGEQLGTIVARQFGVPATPQAVSDAIAVAGEETARAKIAAAVEQARAEIDGFVAIEQSYYATQQVSLTQVGETMRAEIGHEHWFFSGWRPAAGWLFDLYAAVFGGEIALALFQSAFAGNDKPLAAIQAAWPLLLAYLGSLAMMVGVYVYGRSNEKAASFAVAPATAAPSPTKPLQRK